MNAIKCATVAALLLLTTAARARAQNGAGYEGAQVTAVRVTDRGGHNAMPSELSLSLKAGQPFHIEAEEESLRQLYHTCLLYTSRCV